jgi:hypothetical protein
MTPLEKLNALEAGDIAEIDRILIEAGYNPVVFASPQEANNAAKVEVTKVVLPDALKDIEDYFKPIDMSGSPVGGGNWVGKIMDERKEKLDVALTLLQQLKESL